MEYGVYTAETRSDCRGWWTGLGEGSGKWCWLHKGHGVRGLQDGIRDSCDAVFYDLGKNFFYADHDTEGLQEMFRRWGLGSKTGVDLPAEGVGRVPDAEWKESYFKDWSAEEVFYDLGNNYFYPDHETEALHEMHPSSGLGSKTGVDLPAEGVGRVPDAEWKESYCKEWSAEERAWNAGDMTNIAIGQGDILVTPIQMATAYAGIDMNGVDYTPHVLHSVVARDGQGDAYTFEPKKRLTVELKAMPIPSSRRNV